MSERRLGLVKRYVSGDPRRLGFEEIYNSRRESESGVSRELTLEAAGIAAVFAPPEIDVDRGTLSLQNLLSLTKKVCLCQINDFVTSTV